ncbi:hypothetical protein DKM44_12915 [Deinococcus irradiatisoli]|uniref:Uncharacterized protein n=1 Tax=Deinococcus irradiatisoli TaxID=2202254 RepID=A0A2Z3JG64_9DEIO|nr:hypothetical protein [Deinococcus irradiatisoli]AWN24022.1 hypothetical protein DKM44_12915 [Deinococcus irradiatisoli]
MTAFAERWPLTARHTLDLQERRKTLEARARLAVEPLPPRQAQKGPEAHAAATESEASMTS